MANIDELHADVDELQKLVAIVERSSVKQLLQASIGKLESQIAAGCAAVTSSNASVPVPEKVVREPTVRPVNAITTYGWDQSDKFMKIYVTLVGVQKIPKENTTCTFTDRSFRMLTQDLDKRDHCLHVARLDGAVLPAECSHKVKTDMIVVMLKKKESKTWPHVVEKPDKKKDAPKVDDNKDPSAGLMDMLKNMYDEGDDDMKRTIGKAWTDSRNKEPGNLGGMGGL